MHYFDLFIVYLFSIYIYIINNNNYKMNCLLLSTLLIMTIIGQVYGRIVNFSIIAFGKESTVTFNGKTLKMIPVDNFSGVMSVSAICPDEEFE